MSTAPDSSTHAVVAAALQGVTIDPPKPKAWFSTILSTLGLSAPRLTPFAHIFDNVHNKKIILVGLDDAGKTSLLREHICLEREGQDIATRRPMIAIEVETVLYPHNVAFHTLHVGLGRPAFYHKFEKNVAALGDAIVFCMDATNRDRTFEAADEFYLLLKGISSGDAEHKRLENVPILLLMTKQDEEQAMSLEEVQKAFRNTSFDGDPFKDLSAGLKSHPWIMRGTKSKDDVHDAFAWVAEQLKEKVAPEMVQVKRSSASTTNLLP